MVRRSALEQIGGYDTNVSFYGEDTNLATRLSAIGDVKFTFKLPTYSSGRRIAAEGPFKMARRYSMNYVWTTFIKKPYSDSYTDVRTPVDPRKYIGLFQSKPGLMPHRYLLMWIFFIIAFLGVVAGVQASHDLILDNRFVQEINDKVKIISDKASRIYNNLGADDLRTR